MAEAKKLKQLSLSVMPNVIYRIRNLNSKNLLKMTE